MTDHQLLIVAVIALGFLATFAAVVVLAYLLAVDLLSRANNACASPPPGAHGSHDMLASAGGHSAPRGVREVEASELPHQLWTGRLR